MGRLTDSPCTPAGADITLADRYANRQKLRTRGWVTTNAIVDRPVNCADLKWNIDAQTKMQEWIDKLVGCDVWKLDEVRPLSEVASDANGGRDQGKYGQRVRLLPCEGFGNAQRGHKGRKSRVGMYTKAIMLSTSTRNCAAQ